MGPWKEYFTGVTGILFMRLSDKSKRIPFIGKKLSEKFENISLIFIFPILLQKAMENPDIKTQFMSIIDMDDNHPKA